MTRATDSPRLHRRDKPCWRCAYPLRRLPHDSQKCPECGLPVRISLSENSNLDFADPAWVKRLSLASWMMAIATALPIPIFLAPIAIRFLDAEMLLPFGVWFTVLITGLLIASWWIISTPPVYGLWEVRSTVKSIGRLVYGAVLMLVTFFFALAIYRLPQFEPAIVLFVVWVWMAQIAHLSINVRMESILRRQSSRWLRRFNRGALLLSVASFFAPCVVGSPLILLADRTSERTATLAALGVLIGVCALYSAFWMRLGLVLARLGREAKDLWDDGEKS